MIQVWRIDSQGFYLEPDMKNEEELTEFDITTPVNTDETNTFYKPKWDDEKWIEGWTQEEIDEWKAQNNQPSIPSELEVLKEENKMLKTQVQAMTENQTFLEDCIVELAQEVYK